jgi:methylmalonyl-CoA mutase N-terminal domain/subunit
MDLTTLGAGEVGKVGVAIDSLADMERCSTGSRQPRPTSFTINATAAILLGCTRSSESRCRLGRAFEARSRTTSSRSSPARGYIYLPGPSLRLLPTSSSTEPAPPSTRSLPALHLRQGGATQSRIAYTLANASVHPIGRARLDVDEFAGRFSFNISTMRDFFEEIAKHRAARRL